MTDAELLRAIRAVVREELAAALDARKPKSRRRLPCGRGSSPPECWGSAIHGPEGCYCRD